MKTLKHYWTMTLHYLEAGDLIPFLVLISVVHFAGALAKYDAPFVAVAIGIAVDIGMYRLVKAALKHGGMWWGAALAITVVSYFYHVEYYANSSMAWILAIPIPALIILLAALSHKERTTEKLEKTLARELAKLQAAEEKRNANVVPKDANGTNAGDARDTGTVGAPRGTYQEFKLAQLARNGNGPMTAAETMAHFNVPKRTAYRWLSQYRDEVGKVHTEVAE